MVEAICHCGKVRIAIATAPDEVNDCNCSICRRYGTLWAYYHPDQVRIAAAEPTTIYAWGERRIAFHRCGTCGCVSHWLATRPGHPRMGINARLLAPAVLAAARLVHTDGASFGGVTH